MMMPSGVAREVWLTASALLVGMVLVMWAQAPNADCVLPFEASRRLVLTRDVDREHLASDLASASRVARRHGSGAPGSAGTARLTTCEETLFQAIAARHALPPAVVRAWANERLEGSGL